MGERKRGRETDRGIESAEKRERERERAEKTAVEGVRGTEGEIEQ